MKNNKSINREQDLQIMLSEYSLIKDLRSGIVSHMESFVKFYFSLVSAIGAIVAIVSQIFGTNIVFIMSIAVLCVFQLVLGIVTFNRIIEGHISITMYTRGLNRIRKFFVDVSNVQEYLSLPINDDVPKFGKGGFSGRNVKLIGLSTAIATVNSVFFAILIGMINLSLMMNIGINVFVSCIAFITAILLHFRVYNVRADLAEKNYVVKYPSENPSG